MPELMPGVLRKWRTTPVWVIWRNDPKREAASLCLCQLAFIHLEMWPSALVYKWFCARYHCGYLCYLCKSLIELRYWLVCLLDCQRNSMCFYPVTAETSIWQFAPPPGWCLHLRNFICRPCLSIQGASCQNCRRWRQKCGIPLFILTPSIQRMCFTAYHLLVPVKALQLLGQLELPFSFTFSLPHTLHSSGDISLFSGLL